METSIATYMAILAGQARDKGFLDGKGKGGAVCWSWGV